MAKRKNHTGHNATVKDHANGIKKAVNYRKKSLKGVRSQKYAVVINTLYNFPYLYLF